MSEAISSEGAQGTTRGMAGTKAAIPSTWFIIGEHVARWIAAATGIVFWGLIASAAIYGWSQSQSAPPEPPPLSGKELVAACSPFLSVFGGRMLTLAENGHASVHEMDSSGITVDYFGTWKADEATQQVTLKFGGKENVYELATPDSSDWCLLLSGTRGNADMNRSWYSDTEPYYQDDADRP